MYVVILIDEMHVKEGLVFNKSSGTLTGFVDLDDIDNHLRECEHIISTNQQKARTLAKTIVVFMVRGALTDIVFPYAVFPVTSLKGCNIYPLFWNVVERLTRHKFHILAVTCDGASCNRKFFIIHSAEQKLVYKTVNIFSKDRHPIYFICDPPHLLKTLRNGVCQHICYLYDLR